jgi:hypothetical protein
MKYIMQGRIQDFKLGSAPDNSCKNEQRRIIVLHSLFSVNYKNINNGV